MCKFLVQEYASSHPDSPPKGDKKSKSLNSSLTWFSSASSPLTNISVIENPLRSSASCLTGNIELIANSISVVFTNVSDNCRGVIVPLHGGDVNCALCPGRYFRLKI